MTRTPRLNWFVLALAVSIVPPAAADTFPLFSEGGIPAGTDIWTWCDTGQPCDVGEAVTCDNPEGSNSLRVRANLWAGFGVHYGTCGGSLVHCNFPSDCQDPLIGDGTCNWGGLDLSAYENGTVKFFAKSPVDVKVEFKCLGVGHTKFLSQYGWTAPATGQPAAWGEYEIPVCDFFSGGVCDPECLGNMELPFMATIEVPFFSEFRIDHVRWETANAHAGPTQVQIDGRQLLVNGEPFVINGVAYNPVSPCEDWRGAWRDRADRYLVDFPLMAASGANTVRVYAPLLSTAMLDAAWANGLFVIPTFDINPTQLTCANGREYMKDRIREKVMAWKDHPAILLWLVGNEVNINLSGADLCQDWYPQLDAIAQLIHDAEGASWHPVGTANADSAGLGDVCSPGCSDDTALPNVDLWGIHLYRGCSLGGAFTQYEMKSDCARPLFVAEFGADAYDSALGDENQDMQASCLGSLLDQASAGLALNTPGGVSTGQVVFEWADEWWKSTCGDAPDACVQETCADWVQGGYPDPNINEEWWGIVSQDPVDGDPTARGVRTASDTLSAVWNLGNVCNLNIDTFDRTTGDTTVSFDPAPGSTDHTLYYGSLDDLSSYGYSTAVTGLGADGTGAVTLPAGPLFWVVVGRNNGEEGGYGTGVDERPPSSGAPLSQDPHRTGLCSGM